MRCHLRMTNDIATFPRPHLGFRNKSFSFLSILSLCSHCFFVNIHLIFALTTDLHHDDFIAAFAIAALRLRPTLQHRLPLHSSLHHDLVQTSSQCANPHHNVYLGRRRHRLPHRKVHHTLPPSPPHCANPPHPNPSDARRPNAIPHPYRPHFYRSSKRNSLASQVSAGRTGTCAYAYLQSWRLRFGVEFDT